MRLVNLNNEVLVAEEPIVRLSKAGIAALKHHALANSLQRIRICTHLDTSDRLHEMVTAHARESYARTHKHLNKSKPVHLIEGGCISDLSRRGRCGE